MRRIAIIIKISLYLLFVVVAKPLQLSAQCNFNCVDTLNVSVNNLCNATITPRMVLKDPSPGCTYAIELTDQNGNIINLDKTRADIGPQYVGQVLKVRVFQPGFSSPGNSCWSFVNVEDKLPPDIVCVGNDTLECYKPDIFGDESQAAAYLKSRIESKLIDNCGNEDVTVVITRNDLTQMLCLNEFAAKRIIGYNVLDNNLSVTSCEDTIYYERFPLDSIDAPKNFVGNMSISCNEPYPTIEYLLTKDGESPGNNSLPNIGGVSIADYIDSLFVERGLCNFKMTTKDIIFETCGSTFKIVRKWTVIDWCNANFPVNFNQVIKVVDDNLNAGSVSNIGPLAADPGVCDTSVELPFPTVATNECSDWTYSILIQEPGGGFFFPFGGVRDSVPREVFRRFPIGTSNVKYIVKDACDNKDEVNFTVTVEDQEEPVPVCDYRTVITLTDSFLGKANAKSFDDGSYDNCSGIVKYEVRRVDRFETDCPTPSDFSEYVKFCCSDIGKIIMVELRVTDGAGMTSRCMAEAMVQYKGPGPSINCQPDPGIQSCLDFDNFDINTLSAPIVSSNNPCLANSLTPLIRETGRSLNECGDGYINVEWYYNLTGEEEVICSNTITFSNPDPFDITDINWPADRVVNSCDEAPPTAEELASIIDINKPCSNAIVSDPTDRIFDDVPNKCRKILRTWTVVDWCRYPADLSARWSYEQTIEIVNSNGPIIDIGGSNLSLDFKPDSCRAHMIIEGLATDDCTDLEDLIWTYQLDLLQDGQEFPLIPESAGKTLERRMDAGTYIVTWTATDGCGNTSIARQNIQIDDNLAPVAICGFVARDIDQTSSIIVNANELDGGSTDNCGPDYTLAIRRVGDNTPPTSSLTFTCVDIGVNNIELWVTDKMGNQDICIAQVDIRDGQSVCGFGASNIVLDGKVMTPEDVAVENAMVYLTMNNDVVHSKMTEVDGIYQFDGLQKNQLYTLSGQKNDDYLNGISTLDLVLMQRHILGLQKLDNPYKLIAADINKNESISAVDIVILRRLILGHISKFPDNDSWRFIDKSYQFDQPDRPWDFPESIEIGELESSMNKEIVAIKVGDLNANAVANSNIAYQRSTDALILRAQKIEGEDQSLRYQVRTPEQISTVGFQMSIQFNNEELDFRHIRSGIFGIVDDMVSIVGNEIRISVAHAEARKIEANEVLFEIIFDPKNTSSVVNSEIKMNLNSPFDNEIYTSELNPVELEIIESSKIGDFILHQNKPNPFDQETIIEFEIPKKDEVTFELFDINGSRVHSLRRHFNAGRQQILINREDLQLNKGIYYYQIHAQKRSLTMKMIIL